MQLIEKIVGPITNHVGIFSPKVLYRFKNRYILFFSFYMRTKCDIILVAKNGVDGVYSADPNKDKNAKFYESITYQEILEKNLQVMDLTAISMCKENNMPLFVFNMNEPGNIIKAINSKVKGTLVK